MRQTAEMYDHKALNIRSVSASVTPDSRHFIPCGEQEGASWYHHWPLFHCGNQLHAREAVTICQNHLLTSSPAILVYDALFTGARGATPLLQSLLCHCSGYSEAWGISSGSFSPRAASELASRFIKPGHLLIYVHDPLQRLSTIPAQQEVTLNILAYHLRQAS